MRPTESPNPNQPKQRKCQFQVQSFPKHFPCPKTYKISKFKPTALFINPQNSTYDSRLRDFIGLIPYEIKLTILTQGISPLLFLNFLSNLIRTSPFWFFSYLLSFCRKLTRRSDFFDSSGLRTSCPLPEARLS